MGEVNTGRPHALIHSTRSNLAAFGKAADADEPDKDDGKVVGNRDAGTDEARDEELVNTKYIERAALDLYDTVEEGFRADQLGRGAHPSTSR